MADVTIRKTVVIRAETIGDVAKWLARVEAEDNVKMGTPLADIAILTVELDAIDGGSS